MTKSVRSIISLSVICLVVALILGAVNFITAPIIDKQMQNELNSALLVVLPDGAEIEGEVNLSDYENIPKNVTQMYKADAGYVVKIETNGYGDGFIILCGVNSDGTVYKTYVVSDNETHDDSGKISFESYGAQFDGKDLATVESVDTIAGSTSSTKAFKAAVKDALGAVTIVGGGSFDGRTEEEIALDEALPEAEEKFSVWFATEVLEGVKKVYIADNGAGYVFLTNEGEYVGCDAEGVAKGETVLDTAGFVADIKASDPKEIDISVFADLPSAVIKAYKTESGNIVFELKAAGYGITGGDKYHPASGEYIILKATISSDRKLISCITTYHKETEGVGSVCQTEEFYDKFTGRDEEQVGAVDVKGGATKTTEGYQKALLRAFLAFDIINGGEDNEQE